MKWKVWSDDSVSPNLGIRLFCWFCEVDVAYLKELQSVESIEVKTLIYIRTSVSCAVEIYKSSFLIWRCDICVQGRPSPMRQWCILPLFQISPSILENNFQTPWKFSPILPFPNKFLDFHSILVIEYKFLISPYFRYFRTFPPISRELLFPLLFQTVPLIL